MKNNFMLLITGFCQVFFVTVQTWFIAKGNIVGVGFVGFMISLIWTFNVKKAAFGCLGERLSYSVGAAVGAVSGVFVSKMLFSGG